MSPIQSLAVGVRLFAIWLLWYGLTATSNTYFSAHDADPNVPLIAFAFGSILVASICLLLWLFPIFLARKILPKQDDAPSAAPLFEDWFSVGSSLIGVWALARAIPALFSYLIVNYLGQKMYPGSFYVDRAWHLQVAFFILQLIFGLWLFLGAKGLRRILVWVREA